jgi:hypothetical protein
MLVADFYMNISPDYNNCNVVLGILTKNASGSYVYRKTGTYHLDHTGRYGPIKHSVAALPGVPSNGFARINVYDCSWDFRYSKDSPKVYYP